MNKEIKEILDNLKFNVYETGEWIEPLGLSQEVWKQLLDYITNLEQELDLVKNKLIEEHSKNFNAIEFIKEKISSTKGVINDYMYHKEHNKHLIELLKEDIDMYNKELDILTGGDGE